MKTKNFTLIVKFWLGQDLFLKKIRFEIAD